MKVIADDKIPYLKGVLEPFANVVYVPGKDIDQQMLKDADALIVRTRTQCDEQLLKGTSVKFVGTATIGYDHIDTTWCEQQGIVWKNAPGCNANSVNQYIASTLVHLSERFRFSLKDRSLGVVGVGNVGSKVVHTAEMLGMQVYLCDPPRERAEGPCGFISLDGVIRECDIITFHVPLNRTGMDSTYHLIDKELLNRLNKGTFIINTSRGEVANGEKLKEALLQGRIAGAVLDVWEKEPNIDRELLNLCCQATPHIAGYSADGKAMGTAMVIHELSKLFNLGLEHWQTSLVPEPADALIRVDCDGLSNEEILKKAIKCTYDVREDDLKLRQSPGDFEKQRGAYPPRREFNAYTLQLLHGSKEIERICRKIGFKVLS